MNNTKLAKIFYSTLFSVFLFFAAVFPSSAATQPNQVTVGAYITQIFDTNLHTNEYSMTLWLWTIYHPFLEWRGGDSLDFVNAKQLDKLTTAVDRTKDGEVWWQGKYRVTAIADWDVRNFPFDVQNIYLLLEDNLYESEKLQFIPDTKNSGVAPGAISQDWEITKFEIMTKPVYTATSFGDPSTSMGSDFSRIVVHVQLKRENSWSKFFSVFSTNFIALLLSFAVTLMPIEDWGKRISLIAGSTFAAVGGHYALQNLLPYSRYFTLSDKVELLVFCYLFIVLSVSIASGHLYEHKWKRTALVSNFTLVALSVLLLPLFIYLIVTHAMQA